MLNARLVINLGFEPSSIPQPRHPMAVSLSAARLLPCAVLTRSTGA